MHRVPVVALHAQHQLIARDAGVVHEDVDAPVPRQRRGDRGVDRLGWSVTSSVDRLGLAAGRPNLVRHGLRHGSPRAAATTAAPRAASALAIARPIPRDAPVTRATRPSNSPWQPAYFSTRLAEGATGQSAGRTVAPRSMCIEPEQLYDQTRRRAHRHGRPAVRSARRPGSAGRLHAGRARSARARRRLEPRPVLRLHPGHRLDDRHRSEAHVRARADPARPERRAGAGCSAARLQEIAPRRPRRSSAHSRTSDGARRHTRRRCASSGAAICTTRASRRCATRAARSSAASDRAPANRLAARRRRRRCARATSACSASSTRT